jgi:hypothetical protein
MGCDFKPGDELAFIGTGQLWDGETDQPSPDASRVYVCEAVFADCEACEECSSNIGVLINDSNSIPICPCLLRKVERRNDSLSIEAFLTIKPGFEEPRKAPAKKREKVT